MWQVINILKKPMISVVAVAINFPSTNKYDTNETWTLLITNDPHFVIKGRDSNSIQMFTYMLTEK